MVKSGNSPLDAYAVLRFDWLICWVNLRPRGRENEVVMRHKALLTGEPTAWMAYVRGLGVIRAGTISEAEARTRALVRKWSGDPDPQLDLVIDCDVFEATDGYGRVA